MKTVLVVLVAALALAPAVSNTELPWYAQIDPSNGEQHGPGVGAEYGDIEWLDFANQAFDFPLTKEKALEILLKTEEFRNHSEGFGGSPSVQVYAFNVVLEQPDAAGAFQYLFRRGKLAGKLYALCGLFHADPGVYAELLPELSERDDQILSNRGCMVGLWPLQEVLLEIENGSLPSAFRDSAQDAEGQFRKLWGDPSN